MATDPRPPAGSVVQSQRMYHEIRYGLDHHTHTLSNTHMHTLSNTRKAPHIYTCTHTLNNTHRSRGAHTRAAQTLSDTRVSAHTNTHGTHIGGVADRGRSCPRFTEARGKRLRGLQQPGPDSPDIPTFHLISRSAIDVCFKYVRVGEGGRTPRECDGMSR